MSDKAADGIVAPELDDAQEQYDAIKTASCRVDRINVSPPDLRTKLFMIEREFRSARQANTLEEVTSCANDALSRLQDLGVLRRADMELVPGDMSKPGTCHIDVNVEELGILSYQAGSYVSRADVSFEGNIKVRNLTGFCEHQKLEISRSLHHATDVAYVLRQPRVFGLPLHMRALLHQRYESFQAHSSFTEVLRGGSVAALSSDGAHKLAYELSWMQLADRDRVASPSVRRQLGDHIKSAASYTFIHDGRDNPVHPTSGRALKLSTEVGGLSPDANVLRYVRQTLDLQVATALGPRSALTVDANFGLMLPVLDSWTAKKATFIRDRFFLGGVGSLRGFAMRGVGPKDERRGTVDPEKVAGNGDDPTTSPTRSDDLGGDLCASVRAAINFDLPWEAVQRLGIRGHLFADTGSVAQLLGTEAKVEKNLASFWDKWRFSVGGGIQIPFGASGQFEINYVQVLKRYQGDRLCPGLQVGFSSAPFLQQRPAAT